MSDNNKKYIYNNITKELIVLNTNNKVIYSNNETFYKLPTNVLNNPTLFLGKDYLIIDDNIETLPKMLTVSVEFVKVLNYFLFHFVELTIQNFNGVFYLIIKNTLPILNDRYKDMQNYINKHKPMDFTIEYEF